MLANLHRSRGLVFSENVSVRLSHSLGKQAAHALTEKLCETAVREGRTLLEVIRADPQASAAVSGRELEELFDPRLCLGSAEAMIERVLAEWTQSVKT
jgi:adenylosuccinate lyase